MTEEQQPHINLCDVVRVLESIRSEKFPEGIIVPEDLGNHYFCNIFSNCPEAVKLNRVMAEAGLELQEFLEAFENLYPSTPKVAELRIPDIKGEVEVYVGDQCLKVDMGEEIRKQLHMGTLSKVREWEGYANTAQSYALSYVDAYEHAIRQTRINRQLEQLEFPFADLAKYKCLINKVDDKYSLSLPFNYQPVWIVVGRDRYELSQDDQGLLQHDLYLEFLITRDFRMFPPKLKNSRGRFFMHYHGNEGDCWGEVRLPQRWNGGLKQLVDLRDHMEKAIATINVNSLMMARPPDMPSTDALMEEATLLGREGRRMQETVEARMTEGERRTERRLEEILVPIDQPPPRRGWGRRE